MSPRPGRARGRDGGSGSGQRWARPGSELGRHLPSCDWGRAGRGAGSVGRLGVGRSPGRALPSSLWARCSPGTRSQMQKEGTSISLLSRASELLAQPAMPSSPATPATQPTELLWTHVLPAFPMGALGAPHSRDRKTEDQPRRRTKRSKPLSPAQPLSVFRDLEEQSEGRKNRGQKE